MALAVTGAGLCATAATLAAVVAPQAIIERPMQVTQTTALLRAVIAPNANDTNYYYSYGYTAALGSLTPERTVFYNHLSARADTVVRGLEPGTLYFVNLRALGAGGVMSTRTVTFKTLGRAPTGPLTGAATVTSPTAAELTGVIAPSHTPTDFEFAVTTATGQTRNIGQGTLAAGRNPIQVTGRVSGLKPGTTYSYTLISRSTTAVLSHTGAVREFATFPHLAPVPQVTVKTHTTSAAQGPYSVSTYGSVRGPRGTSMSQVDCTGTVTATLSFAGKIVARTLAPLTTGCGYGATAQLGQLPAGAGPGSKLKDSVTFTGNPYLRGVTLAPLFVTIR